MSNYIIEVQVFFFKFSNSCLIVQLIIKSQNALF